jgi:hypothetical protein
MFKEPTTRHNILLYKGDFSKLKILHPHELATSVVRRLVREHIERMDGVKHPDVEEMKEFV